MKILGLVLIVVGLLVAVGSPIWVERQFETDNELYFHLLVGGSARPERSGFLVRADDSRIRRGGAVRSSFWPGVFAGGAAAAVGILVLAITLAGQKRTIEQAISPPTA